MTRILQTKKRICSGDLLLAAKGHSPEREEEEEEGDDDDDETRPLTGPVIGSFLSVGGGVVEGGRSPELEKDEMMDISDVYCPTYGTHLVLNHKAAGFPRAPISKTALTIGVGYVKKSHGI